MTKNPDKAGRQQDGRFAKGVSGNPAGRPLGSRHRATVAAQALLDCEAEGLTRKCVDLALAGDATAMRLCFDRLIPPRRERLVALSLPPLETPANLARAAAALVNAVADGAITPGEAAALSSLVANVGKAMEIAQLEARIAALEGLQKRK